MVHKKVIDIPVNLHQRQTRNMNTISPPTTSEMVRLLKLYNDGKTEKNFTVNGTLVANQPGSGVGSIAIGTNAGSGTIKQGDYSIAIGPEAGRYTQSSETVAVGYNSGLLNQKTLTVAVGAQSGMTNQQADAVAIGGRAGNDNQATKAVAIGGGAGRFSQGSSAIAIGFEAGKTSQHANSILLNATGAELNSNGTSRFYVAPIRGVAHGIGVGVMKYDTVTKEITYSTT